MSGSPVRAARDPTGGAADVPHRTPPIPMPSSVTLTLGRGRVRVAGPKGTLGPRDPRGITIRQDGDMLVVERPDDEREHRALHGLTRSLVANMVRGDRGLLQGARDRGRRLPGHAKGPGALELALGFSHPVFFNAPEGISFEVPAPTRIIVKGSTKRRSARWPRTSASSASPSPTRARASVMPASGSLRKAGKAEK